MTPTPYTRRHVLCVTGAVALSSLAGCSGDTPDAEAETRTPTKTEPATATSTATTTATATQSPTDASAGGDGGLDLREANVVDVSVTLSDGAYRFDVTLYHDDDGEDGYANWWQVETLAGERLGRRELLHAHGTREFTRSETIEIPDGTPCVVVRGHDETHGYGGQAMVVTLDAGEARAVRQGPNPRRIDSC